ncbi:MAG: response regulator transcription factor [Bacteroidetes bacterium]|nr:response regulator transcription factor [Bacteroidota bacterium]
MKNYTAIIIDDETQARNALRDLIQTDFPNISIIGEADGVETAVQAISTKKPQIVFLDINLGDGSGFDVLEQLTNKDFSLIFTTAYSEYAIAAFKLNAIDYLLKPILEEDMGRALEKIDRQNSPNDLSMQLELLKEMVHDSSKATRAEKKIVLKDNESVHFIKMSEIIFCKSEGSYTEFTIAPHQRITVSNNLKEYEEKLAPYNFLRVHHSYIVNIDMIVRYNKGSGGSLILEGGHEIPVSQRKRDMVLDLLSIN